MREGEKQRMTEADTSTYRHSLIQSNNEKLHTSAPCEHQMPS